MKIKVKDGCITSEKDNYYFNEIGLGKHNLDEMMKVDELYYQRWDWWC